MFSSLVRNVKEFALKQLNKNKNPIPFTMSLTWNYLKLLESTFEKSSNINIDTKNGIAFSAFFLYQNFKITCVKRK